MSELTDELVERLRQILAEQPGTEAELRSLTRRAEALEQRLARGVEAIEDRLNELSSASDSSLAETAVLLRRVEIVRVSLDRVRALLENMDERARALRTSWLLGQSGSRRPSER